MIMIGVTCKNCDKELLDSGDKCWNCGHPYDDFVTKMVAGHQKAKNAMIAKMQGDGDVTERRIFHDVETLTEATTALAKMRGSISESGCPEPTPETIDCMFQDNLMR